MDGIYKKLITLVSGIRVANALTAVIIFIGIFEILRTLQYTYISNLPEFSVGSRISQREAPTSEVGAPNHYLAKVLLKTAWK